MDAIWTFTEYRAWMRGWIERERTLRPTVVSVRWMASRLAIDSSLMSKILSGERHLSHSRIQPLCDLVGLEGDEAEYFRQLVHYGKAKGHREAQACFAKIASLRKVSPVGLEGDQSAYWERWENVAVRELLSCGNIPDDPDWIGRVLRPQTTARRVKDALKTLAALGLAGRDDDGFWRRTEPFVRDGATADPVVLRHFHKQNLLLAAEAVDTLPKELRDLSSLTVSIPPEGYPRLVELIHEFHSRVLASVAGMENPDRVYQVGLQLVPRALTKPTEP